MYSYQLHIAVVAVKTGEVLDGNICSEKEKKLHAKNSNGKSRRDNAESHTHWTEDTEQSQAKQN